MWCIWVGFSHHRQWDCGILSIICVTLFNAKWIIITVIYTGYVYFMSDPSPCRIILGNKWISICNLALNRLIFLVFFIFKQSSNDCPIKYGITKVSQNVLVLFQGILTQKQQGNAYSIRMISYFSFCKNMSNLRLIELS